MDLTPELVTLLAIAIVGPAVFAPFELETSPQRKVLKWALVCGVTLGLALIVGHWAIAFPVAAGFAGTTFYFIWCRRNGIHPLYATPRRRYYELRGWTWRE